MSGIPYQEYVRESLRGVIPRVLRQIAASGMVGDHYFYLTFSTTAEGVVIPASLRAQYPASMTIVLQHQFEDLLVDDAGFSVTLRFGGVPERLTIPYSAVTVFVDPSIDFAIQFEGDPSAIAGRPPAKPARVKAQAASTKSDRASSSTSAPDPSDAPPDGDGKVVRVDFSKR